jgi:RND family efflux transporter MFP subunit
MKTLFKTVLVLTVAVLSFVGCSEEEVKKEVIRPIKAMQVGGVEAFTGRWFPGKAKAAQQANLSFRVAGTLNELPVSVGDEVKKGDLLAKLDPRDFEVALSNARAQLSRVQAAVNLAKTEFDRVDKIRQKDPGAVSQSMVDSRRGEYDSAVAQLSSARAEVTRVKDSLAYASLSAPFAGSVAELFVENYEDVKAKQEVVRVVDASGIEFTVQIPESMMAHAPKVKSAFVVFDTYPDVEIPAVIKEIGKEASQTTRTYPVTLSLEQPAEFKVLPGMAGKARGDRSSVEQIALAEQADAVEIPVAATFSGDAGKSFVWVVDDVAKTVGKRAVEIGDLTDNGILVKGLKSGEWIATAGVNSLVEGQKVRIQQ